MPKRTNSQGVSGNPAKRYSDVKEWKRGVGATRLELPSGKVCLAKRVGMQTFLKTEAVPEKLEAFIRDLTDRARIDQLGPELLQDGRLVWQIEQTMDRSLVLTMCSPPVQLPPGCAHEGCGRYLNFSDPVHNRSFDGFQHDYAPPERDDDVLYTDEIDVRDKLFLFNWTMGGTANIESFHRRWAEATAIVGLTMGEESAGVN